MNSPKYSVEDLNNFLNNIPEKTVLKGSSKARFKMMTYAVIAFLMTIAAFFHYYKNAGSIKLVIFLAVVTIFFAILTKLKWKDGNIDIIELNHQHIKIKDINKVIPLEAVTDFSYRHDENDTLTLIIEKPIQGLALTSKVRGAIGASVVITQQAPTQIIKILVPYSFTLDGKNLTPEECLSILDSYFSIAEIKRQLVLANW